MMPSRRLLVTLLVLIFFSAPLSGLLTHIDGENREIESTVEGTGRNTGVQGTKEKSIVAADPISGVLDPVAVEQYGYKGTGLLNARTDSRQNDESVIPIDNATGWVGSQAELEISNMKRLYAENGSLEDGIPGSNYHPSVPTAYPNGWSLDWDDPSSGLQNVSTTYDKDNGYLILESKAELATPGGIVEYRHWDGTYIYWNQTIHNAPYSDNLTLSFMYNYDSGIIDNPPLQVAGWLWLDVLIDGAYVAYSDLMTECPSRNTWYEFVVPNLLNLPSTFNLQIGISVEAVTPPPADYFVTNPGADYDGDSELDLGLAQINRVFLDNISLLSVNQPTYDAVNLTFNAGVISSPITEFSNYGTAVITNPSYWEDSFLDVGVSANVTVSFDYEVKLLSYNFGESLWTSQPTKQGVSYTIDAGASAALSAFTYVGSEGVAIYENFTVEFYLPLDWENVTVFDPFLNDVTGLCTFVPGSLEIPTSILNRLGWWQLTLDSPNYAESIKTQIFDTGWIDGTLFRPGNVTRVSLTLGTVTDTPIIADPVNVTWYSPSDATWSLDSVTTGIGGVVNTDQRTLGGLNTSAGLWSVVALWTNGTEVAYGSTTFDMYHTASLVVPPTYTTIQTDVGPIISNFVYYRDADTLGYLLDESVTITANWSGTEVPFTQDLVKNWWRGEFDTSLVEGGQYTVVVTASRPYFDNVTTQFVVIAIEQTTFEILNAGTLPIERGLNEVFTAQMDYELLNGTGIAGASISISHSGPGSGLSWHSFTDYNNGHYSVDVVCDISATYEVTITLSKPYHYNTSDSFTMIIGETGSELELLNGTADFVLFGESYRLLVEYRNSTGGGLSEADVQVISVTPVSGLAYTNFTDLIDGLYEITLSPTTAGTYTIVIRASILNHETKYATFTITATGLPTVLASLPSSASIAVDHNFTVQLRFQDESMNPIDLATVVVINPPAGILISDVLPLGGGLYNFTLTPLGIGSFDLLFRASADNYQSSSASFTLSATTIPTVLEFTEGVTIVQVKYQVPYKLNVSYYRSDTPVRENVGGADLTILVQQPGLEIEIVEYVGYYMITITGEAIGSWSLTISANKTDYRLATRSFLFQVVEIPVTIEVLEGLQGPEGFATTLRVRLSETDTGDPVTGATVFYDVFRLDGTPVGDREGMTESASEPGIYTALLAMPSADGSYYIEISCNIINYVLDEPLTRQLLPSRDFVTMIYMTVRTYSYVFIGLGALVIGLAYRRSARKRRIRQNKVTLAIKRRFDDVRNLLGVIVLHKDSGLPVYSKILREGLEETVISAFITAITSFRGEFDIETSTEEWGLIPISDIVRVISTNRLICAFITTGNPSPEQRERMIQFAKTVGFIFDETMENVPIVVLDRHTTMQFNALFDDILDGALLRTYKLDDARKFPTASCADERIARKKGEEFKLEELASEIAACGLEEGRVYQAIMRALENNLLVTTDESPFATKIIRAPDLIEEEG
jgi:hypothetical protein